VSWTDGAANGSPITGYKVSVNGSEQTCTTSNCLIGSLTPGQTYNIQVVATNKYGDSEATTVPYQHNATAKTPAAPSLAAGSGKVTVGWTEVDAPFGGATRLPAFMVRPVAGVVGFVSSYADGAHMATDSQGAAIMAAVYSHLAHAALSDELGDEYPTDPRLLGKLVADLDNPLWDDTATPEVEDASVIMQRAWAEADADLTAQMGEDHGAWTWGGIHVKKPTHQLLGGEGLPGIVRNHFNAAPRPVGGSQYTPNASWFDTTVGEDGRVDYSKIGSGPSMRMTVDMGDLDGARWVISSGASGHPWSPHVNDQFEAWAEGRLFAWPFSSTVAPFSVFFVVSVPVATALP